MEIKDLKHVRRELPGGGQVVVLDTGAVIDAEADAMLQALHSRSVGGIDAHLLKLAKKGAADFMDTYYVGYGDKSIGDCGTATIFIEGVSMLVAKAVQDSQLYNGQESSTRYVDFREQPFVDPKGSTESHQLLEDLRAFHVEGLEIMREKLESEQPRGKDEAEDIWKKAIKARAFDIMRCFLPAGAATNLAWHTELRHAADHIQRLRNHQLAEVRSVAETILSALQEKYPHSFNQKRYEATEEYLAAWLQGGYYFKGEGSTIPSFPEVRLERNNVDQKLLVLYQSALKHRPVKAELPRAIAECGTMRFVFRLDFGSFRDIQRHRAVTQRMPLLTTLWGFESWYLEQMPEDLRKKAYEILDRHAAALIALHLNPDLEQYYIPMGYRVPCRVTGDLAALTWLIELRSGIAVHPTLRLIAQNMGKLVLQEFRDLELRLYIDETPDRFNLKRGEHDIIEKH